MDDDFQHSISYHANTTVKKRRSSMTTSYDSRRKTLTLSNRPVSKDQGSRKESNEAFQMKKAAIESLVNMSHYRASKQTASKDVSSKYVAFQCLLDAAASDARSPKQNTAPKGFVGHEGTVQMQHQERVDSSRGISNQSGDFCKRKRPKGSDECQWPVNSDHVGQNLAFKVKKARSARCIMKKTFKEDANSMSPLSSICTENSDIPHGKQPIKIKISFPAKETNVQHPKSACGKENVSVDMPALVSDTKDKNGDTAKVYVKRKISMVEGESDMQNVKAPNSKENIVASIASLAPTVQNCDDCNMQQHITVSVGTETKVDIKIPEDKNVAARTEILNTRDTQINDACIRDNKKEIAGTGSVRSECPQKSDDTVTRHSIKRSVPFVGKGTQVHTRTPINTKSVTDGAESPSYECPQNKSPNVELMVVENKPFIRSLNRQQKDTKSQVLSDCSSQGILGIINIHDQSPTLVHRRVIGLSRRFRPPPLHPYLLKVNR